MIFELINGKAIPTVHALLIEPFKTIWRLDTTSDKENAIRVFSYIELMCSPKKSNPFSGFDEAQRGSKVKQEVFGDANKRDTSFMITGIQKYKELLQNCSPSYSLLIGALVAKEKLQAYLETFNLTERTKAGTAVIKPRDITSALKEIPDVAKGLETTILKVQMEIDESTKTRNQREIGQYER